MTTVSVLAVVAVSVVTATPLKLNPPLFRHADLRKGKSLELRISEKD